MSQESDATARRIALLEEQARIDQGREKDAEENARLRVAYQELLDRPRHAALQKKLHDTAKGMAATNCRIEKYELLRRGVVRGRKGDWTPTNAGPLDEDSLRFTTAAIASAIWSCNCLRPKHADRIFGVAQDGADD
jgi:hypothetical protein